MLNDGFKSSFDARYGVVNGQAYLRIDVVGNDGGFPADVYTNLVAVDAIFSPERLTVFRRWLN